MLWLLLCLAFQAPDPGPQSGPDLDALLSAVDPPARPLTSTGRLLSMETVQPTPGLVGALAFGDAIPGTSALLRAEFSNWGALFSPVLLESVHAPSHLRRTFDLGSGLRLVERAFITGDDAAVVLLAFENGSEQERALEMLLSSDLAAEPDRSQSRQHPIGLPSGERTFPLRLDGVDFALTRSAGEGPAPLSCGTFPVRDVAGARAVLHLAVTGDEPVDGGALQAVLSDGSRLRPSPDMARGLSSAATGAGAGTGTGAPSIISWVPPPGRFFRQLLVVGKTEGADAITGPDILAATLEVLPEVGRPPVLRGSFAWPGADSGRAVHATLAATDTIVVTDKYPYHGRPGRGAGRGLLRRVELSPGETRTVTAVLALAGRPLVSFLQAMGRTEDPDSLARQRNAYTRWFTDQVPAFTCSNPQVERSWWLGWVELRRRMVSSHGGAGGQLVVGRAEARASASASARVSAHASARVSARAEALPEVVANLRWLRERSTLESQLRAFARKPVPLAVAFDGSPLAVADEAGDGGDAQTPAHALLRALELLPPDDGLRSLAELVTPPAGEAPVPHARHNKPNATPDEILRRLTGIRFLEDGTLQLDPDPGTLEHFRFERIPWAGSELGVIWDRPGGPRRDALYPEGLTITVDGTPIKGSTEPTPFVLGRDSVD